MRLVVCGMGAGNKWRCAFEARSSRKLGAGNIGIINPCQNSRGRCMTRIGMTRKRLSCSLADLRGAPEVARRAPSAVRSGIKLSFITEADAHQ